MYGQGGKPKRFDSAELAITAQPDRYVAPSLKFAFAGIECRSIDARRRARFEPAQVEPEVKQAGAKIDIGSIPRPRARRARFARDHSCPQKGPGGDDHSFRLNGPGRATQYSGDLVI